MRDHPQDGHRNPLRNLALSEWRGFLLPKITNPLTRLQTQARPSMPTGKQKWPPQFWTMRGPLGMSDLGEGSNRRKRPLRKKQTVGRDFWSTNQTLRGCKLSPLNRRGCKLSPLKQKRLQTVAPQPKRSQTVAVRTLRYSESRVKRFFSKDSLFAASFKKERDFA
jgi:hypothetical protein